MQKPIYPHRNPMEIINRRRKSNSGEMFSFPSTPTQDEDSEFEFGSVTPDSPSTDPYKNSPADHLFFNGRLLPHAFPIPPTHGFPDNSRVTSRTSSKDSLMSSRSNSTNSRSSSCSSARTSSSDNSERKLFYQSKFASKTTMAAARDRSYQGNNNKAFSAQTLYGSSQRWQYITPVPVLSRESSRRKKAELVGNKEQRALTKQGRERKSAASSWFGFKFFWWFVSACKECHAMEPSRKDDHVLRGNVKL